MWLQREIRLKPKPRGFHLVTGEVLGERPMSQTRPGLNAVLKLSADRDLVLRPLSGQCHPGADRGQQAEDQERCDELLHG